MDIYYDFSLFIWLIETVGFRLQFLAMTKLM